MSIGFTGGGAAGAPTNATYITQTTDGTLTNEQALSLLGTGLLKNTTGTGVLTIGVEGTDYYGPGGTDVAIADGGTGQSTRQAAIDALTDVASATNEFVLTKDTGTGNAIFKILPAGAAAYNQAQEEGVNLSQRTILDFVGAGITASDTGSKTQISLDTTLNSLAAFNTNGLVTQTAADTFTGRSLTQPAAGITISNSDGVSGNPTFALANDLLAIEGLASTGIAVRSASDTWVQRSITQPAAGITVSDGDGVAGNPTLALANDLLALEGLAGTGIAVRSASDTWVQRTITQPAAGITVSDGDGVAGNPTLALADDLLALEGLASTGLAARTAANTWAQRTVTGTAARIAVSNGDGVSGNPTIDIDAAYVGQTSITTLGTIATGTWNGTDIAVADGGTGASTASAARTNLGVDYENENIILATQVFA